MENKKLNISFNNLFSNSNKDEKLELVDNQNKKIKKPILEVFNKIKHPIGVVLLSIASISSVILYKDISVFYQNQNKYMTFSSLNVFFNKNDINHLDNKTTSFIKNYEDMKLLNFENNILNYILLFGDLSTAAIDTNHPDSMYYYYGKNSKSNLTFQKENKKSYFESDIYKKNKETQQFYFHKLLNNFNTHNISSDFSIDNVSVLGKFIFTNVFDSTHELLNEKALRAAYSAYYAIENVKEIHDFQTHPNFDMNELASLNSMTTEQINDYYKQNFAKDFGGNEMPEYIKAIFIKNSIDINIIKAKLKELSELSNG